MAPHENEPATTWVDDKSDAWTVPSSLGVYWLNLHTMPARGSSTKAVEGFHIFLTRSWVWTIFLRALLCLAVTSRQSTAAFG